MHKLVSIMILALPCAIYAQTPDRFSPTPATYASNVPGTASSSAATGDQPASTQSAPLPASTDRPRIVPVGFVAENFVYVEAPGLYGADRSLIGASITPEVNLVRHIGIQADFETLSMRGINAPDQTRIIMAAGPRVSFAPMFHVNPFVFAEGGEMRLSIERAPIDWIPVVKGGFGFEYKVSPRFSFQLIPGEYLGEALDNGTWNHGFSSQVGLKFNLTRNRYPSS